MCSGMIPGKNGQKYGIARHPKQTIAGYASFIIFLRHPSHRAFPMISIASFPDYLPFLYDFFTHTHYTGYFICRQYRFPPVM